MSQPSKIGVVYASKSGIIRRIIVPEPGEDEHHVLRDPVHVQSGESLLVMKKGSMTEIHAAVQAVIGKSPPSSRCSLIDHNGKVVGMVHADPDLDTVPGHKLVLHE